MAARSAFIVAWADEKGLLPSQAFELFEGKEADLTILRTWRNYRAKREKELLEEERKAAGQKPAR